MGITLGRIAASYMLYHPSDETLRNCVKNMLSEAGVDSFDAVVTGISGDEENDKVYKKNFDTLYEGKPVLQYKQIFGECFQFFGLRLVRCHNCLSRGSMPKHLIYKGQPIVPKAILIHNHFQDKDHSLYPSGMLRLIILVISQSVLLVAAQSFLKISVMLFGNSLGLGIFQDCILPIWQFAVSGVCVLSAMIVWMYTSNTTISVWHILLSISYVIGPLAAFFIFHETIPLTRWIGVVIVMISVYFIAK